ncbi:EamA family transporter [Flavobacterium sp.]|uniref:EamA family transporter n=1 Tax=Flavobacterium sp. TaxID=239 RepID=UPI00374D6929
MEKWKVFAIVSMLFAGLTSVIAKYGMKNLSSDVALSIRTIVVFFIIVLNALVFNDVLQQLKTAPKSNLIFLAISGVTTSLSWIFYYKAIKIGNVSEVALIDKVSIVITLLLSFIILKEPITSKLILGSIFILIGMMIIIWK